jgi:integrase
MEDGRMEEESRLKSFLSQYRSKKTVETYRWATVEFLRSVYRNDNHDENSNRYFTEKRDYEKDIRNFLSAISSKPPLSIRLMLAVVKSFLIENEVEFSQKFWRGINRKIKGTRAATMDEPPRIEELRSIIAHTPIQGKALFLMLASSGMRIGETLQLKLNDVELNRDPARISLQREYTKTGNSRVTFMSSEAKEAVNEWMKVRSDYLVAAVAKSKKRPQYKAEFAGKSLKDDRLFPFDIPTAYYIWRNALKKSGFDKRDNGTKRSVFHPHVLRKFFRSQMAQLIPVDVVEALMGHEEYLTDVYRRYTCVQLAEFYAKGESSVLIFGKGENVSELKENLKVVNRAIQTVTDDLETKNMRLEERVQSLQKQINEMYKFVHKNFDPVLDLFNEIVSTPEGQALRDKILREKLEKEWAETETK